MVEKITKTKASESAPAPLQESSDAPRQMNGSQDAPSTNSPSITQSKGRSNSK
jgi:hypothetical protein